MTSASVGTLSLMIPARIDWNTLAGDVALIEGALVQLGLANATGALEAYAERSAMREATDPGIAFERTLEYGVREGNVKALEVRWTQRFHKGDSI